MRGLGDNTNVAVSLAYTRKVLPDHEKAGVLARRATRWLQGASIKASDAAHVLLQGCQQFTISSCVAVWREGVHVHYFGPTAGGERGD